IRPGEHLVGGHLRVEFHDDDLVVEVESRTWNSEPRQPDRHIAGNGQRLPRQGSTPIADGTRLIHSLRCMREVIEAITVERVEDRWGALEGEANGTASVRPDNSAALRH